MKKLIIIGAGAASAILLHKQAQIEISGDQQFLEPDGRRNS
jgi:hypothetical protein